MKSKKDKISKKNVKTEFEPTFFDRLSDKRKNWLCVGLMAIIILILFWNIFFQGMIFAVSGDAAAFNAWKQAMDTIKASENRSDVFWIPHVFSGMPVFGTLILPKDVSYIEKFFLRLPIEFLFANSGEVRDVIHIFLSGLFTFFLCRAIQIPHFVALLAALILMLNPYAIGALEAHQGSKLHALSIIPLFFLLTYKLFYSLKESKLSYWMNLIMFGGLALVTGWLMLSLHIQIIFYGLLFVGAFLLYQIVVSIKREPVKTLRNVIIIGLALALGLIISAYVNLPTLEYSQYSIRGGSEGSQGGLNYDYATSWSFHPFEMINYLIPSFFGFSSPFYWGWMPFTESTVYIGIVPVILSVIAVVYKRNHMTWFLLIFSIFMFFISYGRHFSILYDLMFNYFPYFNKFRVPVLILHLMPLTLGILGAIGLTALKEVNILESIKLKKGLAIALFTIGGILIIGLIAQETIYSALSGFMFQRKDDIAQLQQQYGSQASRVLEQLKKMRFDLLWEDFVKFAIIAGISIGTILFYLRKKFSFTVLTLGLVVITAIDLIIIDVKFINPKPNTIVNEYFRPDATTKFLLSDTTIYRIYPVGGSFQDNTWMYHNINSVGGYSPAKLRIYQEMIDSIGLYPPRLPLNIKMLNMLNVKYIISPGQLPDFDMPVVNTDQSKQIVTYQNPNVLPRAYFVDTAIVVSSKSETFTVLNSRNWDPVKIAVLNKVPSQQIMRSDSNDVKILKYWSQEIILKSYCNNQSLLILSDTYYPAGWSAEIDGKETEIYQTNYVVRSVVVPAGEHTIKFSYSPTKVYNLSYILSNAGYIFAMVFIAAGFIRMKNQKKDVVAEENKKLNRIK